MAPILSETSSPHNPSDPARRQAPAVGPRCLPEQRLWYLTWRAALAAVELRGHPETLEEGVALYLQDLERRGRQVFTTCRDAWYALRGFLSWTAERDHARLEDLTTDRLLAYLRHLVTDRQLSAYYLKQIRSCLKQLLRFLADAGWIAEDLSSRLRFTTRLPRDPPRRVLAPEELTLLLAAPRRWRDNYRGKWKTRHGWLAIRDEAILTLLVGTGVRACEASRLCLEDMDLDRGLAIVHSKGHSIYIRPQRVIFLDTAKLKTALEAYLDVRPHNAVPQLFTAASGIPLQPATIWQIVTKYAHVADLGESVTPHCLRHTFCSHLITAGLDPYSVQTLMGHRNVAHTLRWYTHLSPDQLRAEWKTYQPLLTGVSP